MDHFEKPSLTINDDIFNFLNETRKWTNFLSILGFIGIGFMILIALFAGAFMTGMEGIYGDSPLTGGMLTAIYLLLALFYFFPVLYLYKFSAKMKIALRDTSEASLTEAFANLKSHYKFLGILFIIILSIYVLLFIVGIIAGGVSMF